MMGAYWTPGTPFKRKRSVFLGMEQPAGLSAGTVNVYKKGQETRIDSVMVKYLRAIMAKRALLFVMWMEVAT